MDNLDILKWWSNTAIRFPIVSRMAKDLLTIPASTVASESAFSVGKRVLSDKRCKLSEKSVEASICLKNWYDAVDHLQRLSLNDKSEDEDTTSTSTRTGTDSTHD